MKSMSNFLFEAQTLKRLKRVGWQILGENEENIADHSFLTAVITLVLSYKLKVNREKALTMALLHDFHEVRTGDVDKMSAYYVKKDTQKANCDAFGNLEFGNDLIKISEEYENRQSLEAKVVYEANILALLVELKILVDKGSKHAKEWFLGNKARLRLKEAKELADGIAETDYQDFWSDVRNKLRKEFKK